ncbi:hypothetical protein DRQ20_04955 [bacterium]|nr:MAG: hypothetical protein DRQ20_04955 [bacterium]
MLVLFALEVSVLGQGNLYVDPSFSSSGKCLGYIECVPELHDTLYTRRDSLKVVVYSLENRKKEVIYKSLFRGNAKVPAVAYHPDMLFSLLWLSDSLLLFSDDGFSLKIFNLNTGSISVIKKLHEYYWKENVGIYKMFRIKENKIGLIDGILGGIYIFDMKEGKIKKIAGDGYPFSISRVIETEDAFFFAVNGETLFRFLKEEEKKEAIFVKGEIKSVYPVSIHKDTLLFYGGYPSKKELYYLKSSGKAWGKYSGIWKVKVWNPETSVIESVPWYSDLQKKGLYEIVAWTPDSSFCVVRWEDESLWKERLLHQTVCRPERLCLIKIK